MAHGDVRFEFDPKFEDNIYRASNNSRSSLHHLYDRVREVTDYIADSVRLYMEWEKGRAEAEATAIKNTKWNSNYGGKGRRGWLEAKAKVFALKSAQATTHPTMGYDGREIYGRVEINRRGSASLEFGGTDPVAELGKGTGQYLSHPAYHFLLRAINRI